MCQGRVNRSVHITRHTLPVFQHALHTPHDSWLKTFQWKSSGKFIKHDCGKTNIMWLLFLCVDLLQNELWKKAWKIIYVEVGWVTQKFKGVVYFKKKKKTFADNLLTPMSFSLQSKIIFFWWKHSRIFLHIMDFTGYQTVQGPKDSFSANYKLFKGL